jgi:hypothetical protein
MSAYPQSASSTRSYTFPHLIGGRNMSMAGGILSALPQSPMEPPSPLPEGGPFIECFSRSSSGLCLFDPGWELQGIYGCVL